MGQNFKSLGLYKLSEFILKSRLASSYHHPLSQINLKVCSHVTDKLKKPLEVLTKLP